MLSQIFLNFRVESLCYHLFKSKIEDRTLKDGTPENIH
jgi:hypothetical protein